MPEKFDRYTISRSRHGDGFDVHGWSTYPESSVLAGQPRKAFLDWFGSEEAARMAFPQAQAGLSHRWLEPQVSLSHLPGPDDPVPGGMYPDDIDH